MDDHLQDAAKRGDTEMLYTLLRENPKLFDSIADERFAVTPLHVAVSSNHYESNGSPDEREDAASRMAEFALEMAILEPSFTRKLNTDGLTPMHLALLHEKWETVRALMKHDPELLRVKGKGGKTPLHVAAEIAPPQLFAELLYACPSSIEDLTSRRKTALHIVVEATRLESLEILLGWLFKRYNEEFLYWKDIDGNTILHVAARTNQIQLVKRLLKYMRDDVKNCKGDTALAIHERNNGPGRSEEIGCVLQGAKGYMALLLKKYRLMVTSYRVRHLAEIEGTNRRIIIPLSRRTNFRSQEICLAVAMLVATMTYQGVLSPPGGFWQGDSSIANTMPDITTNYTAAAQSAGKMVMSGDFLSDYIIANSGAFSISVGLIIGSLPVSWEAVYILLSMAYFLISYRFAIHSILPPGENELQDQVDSNFYFGMKVALVLLYFRVNRRKSDTAIKLNTAGRGRLGGFAKLRDLMRMLLDRSRGTRDGSLDDHTVGNRVRDHP